jgi:hypothetical protein
MPVFSASIFSQSASNGNTDPMNESATAIC